FAQIAVAVPRKELAEILPSAPLLQVIRQQPLDRIRNFPRQAAIADWTRDGLVKSDGSAHTKVVRVLHAIADLDLFPLKPYVSDPVLSATIGTTGDVKFQMLLKSGKSFFQFFHEPTRERLGFSDGEFAIFGPAASHGSAPERRALNR